MSAVISFLVSDMYCTDTLLICYVCLYCYATYINKYYLLCILIINQIITQFLNLLYLGGRVPFQIGVHFSDNEETGEDVNNPLGLIGFSLNYHQVQC